MDNYLARSMPHLLAYEAQGLLLFLLDRALEGDKIIATFGKLSKNLNNCIHLPIRLRGRELERRQRHLLSSLTTSPE